MNFIVLASQRTGSNMLVSALDNHPEIRCHGELFRRKNNEMTGALRILKDLSPAFQSEEYREAHFREYLQEIMEREMKKSLFGFKLMLSQAEQAREALIREPKMKKVLLFRENMLAMFASNLIAKTTGQGAVIIGKEVKQAKVEFDPEAFEKFRVRHSKLLEKTRTQINERPVDEWMETEYLKICRKEGIAAIMRFIGVDPEAAPIIVSTVKRNTSNILDRFTNPDVAFSHLKSIDNPDWSTENFPSTSQQIETFE